MVQWKLVIFFCLLSIFKMVNGEIIMVVDDNFEICRENGDPALFDISQMKIEQHNDTYTYLEGSIKILETIQSPAYVHGFAEREMKGKWERSVGDRKIPDICPLVQNPHEMWYSLTKSFNYKECPFPAGTKITADRIEVSKSPIKLQSFMIGNWRMTITLEIKNGMKIMKDCYRFYYTITES